jgi:hypothetical protein
MPQERHLGGEPQQPSPLPPDLADFLRTQEMACLMQATDQGTAFVVKLPNREIASVRGTIPIGLRHELYAHPAAPVIRTVLTLYDQPALPLVLETYTNVAEPDQATDFAGLAAHERVLLLFYDQTLAHRLTKVVPHREAEAVTTVLERARRLAAAILPEDYNFDQAKADVIKQTNLP